MKLLLAEDKDIAVLLPLVTAYHRFEKITSSDNDRRNSVLPLLSENTSLGRIWLIENQSETVGYIAICFGYSIELGGRDAFIDEFFIKESACGQGIGSKVLKEIKIRARKLNIVALHLEVNRNNEREKIYIPRSVFHHVSSSILCHSCYEAIRTNPTIEYVSVQRKWLVTSLE